MSRPVLLVLSLLFSPVVAFAQQGNADELAPEVIKEKVKQWIQTKKQIAEEAANWETEKQLLTDLVALRDREAEQMNEVIDLAKERVADIQKKSDDLTGEETASQAWRQDFERRVTALEDQLIPRLPFLPKPLTDKLHSEITHLKDRGDEADLQTRFRDVLAIITECVSFNREIHALPEIQTHGGKEIEVEVLYLGMNQAWYVDRTNSIAGVGVPTQKGWVWKEAPAIAAKVRKAIEIQTKSIPPDFAELPLANGKVEK